MLTIAIAIAPAVLWFRDRLGQTETWVVNNASRAQVAALERGLQSRAIPFDWRRNRLRLPTVGIGGSSLLRQELSILPRPILPFSGVFFLAWAR